jgi:ER-bound oxygenase mpaB/B'/Rubber oxygenase, catalytic domain
MEMTTEMKRSPAPNPQMPQPLTSGSDGAVRRCPSEIEQLYYGRHRMAFRIGTYLALIRMMGIAHLVESLYGHTKLVSETHARLARTRQTLVDLICYGFDSPEGSAAIQRLRDVHRDLKVSPEDYQYVLATFFLEPLRWSEQHGSKAVTQDEANLLLRFWMQVGHAMSIPNLPASLREWKDFQKDYEARYMGFTSQGHRLALMCLRDVVKLSLPRGTQGIFRQIMIATIEPAVRQSLGIATPHWSARLPVRILL